MVSKLAVAVSLGLLCAAAIGADRIAIKIGLWEITHASDMDGRPPIPEEMLAQLPPEQRARMEAALKARGGDAGGGNHAIRECLTDKDRDRPFRPDSDAGSHCSHTIVSRTATSMEMHMECKDMGRAGTTADGTFKWQAPTPESMQGTVEMHMSDGTQTMTHRTRMTGKWLGADCGSVKPRG